jgi:hypothetical protein
MRYCYSYNCFNERNIRDLKGKIIEEIDGLRPGNDEVYFRCSDGTEFLMHHWQNCCESVEIDDVCGDVDDLIGSEILVAEEVTNKDTPPKDEYDTSWTWTFYKLATMKGYVDIKWYGTSNGYYSESVDFCEIDRKA